MNILFYIVECQAIARCFIADFDEKERKWIEASLNDSTQSLAYGYIVYVGGWQEWYHTQNITRVRTRVAILWTALITVACGLIGLRAFTPERKIPPLV